MSTLALESALSGLRIAQQQLTTISTNIANVQTPGYTRKILPQSVRTVANEAVGVTADPIIRKVDLFLTRDVWTQVSSVGGLDTTLAYLNKIQQFHGDPSAETTISAKIAALKDAFSSLSDDPTNTFSLSNALGKAEDVVDSVNDFSSLLTQMRNDADGEIAVGVDRLNSLLNQVANLNRQIQSATGQERSTATIQDLRDQAVEEISKLVNISFFIRGDGVMVVQTKTGVQLADEVATDLYFAESNIGAENAYPASVGGIYIGGNPVTEPTAYDIIPYGLGGKLGALVDLRDTTLPRYQAQLDELSYRMAQRFDSEGLRLFVDENNTLPLDTAPTPNPPGPLTPVPYTGFSASMRINPDIKEDITLLQKGTNGDILQTGSNEVIRRVVEFAFGATEYQSLEGTRDVRVVANVAGDTLQENLGLFSQNTLVSSRNTAQYTTDMNVAPGNPYNPTNTPPLQDEFTLRIFDTRLPADSGTLTIDLTTAATNYPIGSAGLGAGIGTVDNAAEQVASYLNSLTWPASLDVRASVNSYGQLTLNTRGNVTIGGGTMGTAGLDFMGLAVGTYNTTDPYFDIQVGNNPATRISIQPGDTETNLAAALSAVPGIDTTTLIDASGHLMLQPLRGGDIKITGGPFTSDAAGFSTAGGLTIVEELFGTNNPLVTHAHAAFRSTQLGPAVNLGTSILTASSLTDYGEKLVNAQTQDQVNASSARDDADSYRATLAKKLLDDSGVNLDEELSNMIVVQTAYAAAARAITTVNDMFDDLINAVR